MSLLGGFISISNLSTADVKAFFEGLGVELKTERGRRVFPVSDKAQDIVFALKRAMQDYGCKLVNEKVISLNVSENGITGLKTIKADYSFDAVILASGGVSYPQTGSDGDGFKMVKPYGINVTPLLPSLWVSSVRKKKPCYRMW